MTGEHVTNVQKIQQPRQSIEIDAVDRHAPVPEPRDAVLVDQLFIARKFERVRAAKTFQAIERLRTRE
jgi:hypothetical protein